MEIAKEILRQLGGNAFVMITGAKNLGGGKDSLSFRVPASNDGINHVSIKLNAADTYDIKFSRAWGTKFNTIKTVEGIYCDMLVETFEQNTGLYAHF